MSKAVTGQSAVLTFDTLDLDQDVRAKFDRFRGLLIERNQHVNLTAITEPQQIDEKHFADSLAIRLWPEFGGHGKMIDIGCGGGFPGLPVKIACPDVDVTLMDASAKKLDFVGDVIEKLKLERAETVHARAEELGRDPDHRGQYDLATTRAVAPLAVLVEYALPLLKVGGHLVAYKQCGTGEAAQAARALDEIGGTLEEEILYSVPEGGERELIIIRKVEETPERYPRRNGKPAKDPII